MFVFFAVDVSVISPLDLAAAEFTNILSAQKQRQMRSVQSSMLQLITGEARSLYFNYILPPSAPPDHLTRHVTCLKHWPCFSGGTLCSLLSMILTSVVLQPHHAIINVLRPVTEWTGSQVQGYHSRYLRPSTSRSEGTAVSTEI